MPLKYMDETEPLISERKASAMELWEQVPLASGKQTSFPTPHLNEGSGLDTGWRELHATLKSVYRRMYEQCPPVIPSNRAAYPCGYR